MLGYNIPENKLTGKIRILKMALIAAAVFISMSYLIDGYNTG
jgi:hypothetical protein